VSQKALVLAVVLAALVAPQVTNAQSPRNMMVELKFGPYYPNIDKEFSSKQPFSEVFGTSQRLMSKFEYDYEFFTGFGALAVGGSIGYSQFKGHGLLATGEKSSDTTKLHLLPLSLDLIYRFDWLWQKHKVPFVVYAKGGIDCYVWWVTNGVGDISKSSDGKKGRGATFGGHLSLGAAFVLNSLAPGMAQTFDVEMGVKTTLLFAEYVFSWIDDFGSKKSWDLGSRTFLVGIAFEF